MGLCTVSPAPASIVIVEVVWLQRVWHKDELLWCRDRISWSSGRCLGRILLCQNRLCHRQGCGCKKQRKEESFHSVMIFVIVICGQKYSLNHNYRHNIVQKDKNIVFSYFFFANSEKMISFANNTTILIDNY